MHSTMDLNQFLPNKDVLLTKIRTGMVIIQAKVVNILSLNKKTLLIVCIILAILFMCVVYFISDPAKSNYSKFFDDKMHALRINETLYFHQYLNMGISLEGDHDCNLINRSRCYTTQKSLIVSFWREGSRDKWITKNLLKFFKEEHFTHIIMVHDKSNWSNFPNHDRLIWIHITAQKRFWYLKRFLTPPILKAYKYIWILDDDVELLFNPLHYECVISQLNISFSSPGRGKGIASHSITRTHQDYVNKIGRWTDFVEIGPIFIGSSNAWQCLWHYMSAFVGLGWGFDLVWCRLLAYKCSLNSTIERSCAVLDIFTVNHLSEYIVSTAAGSQEIPAYNDYYGSFHTRQANIAPLANDLKIYYSCNKTR